jgi:hypothetical protein
MTINIYGELTAAANDGSLRFKLLPFGEPGSTNKGKVTVAGPGIVKLPADPSVIHANFEHEKRRPLGKATALDEEADGIYATFMPANTTAGRDWHEEAKAGLRTGISVELAQPVIRDGDLLAADLTGAGAVVKPAFESAQLLTAADTGDVDDDLAAAAAAIAAAREKLKPADDNATDDTPPFITASHHSKGTPLMAKKPAMPPLFASNAPALEDDEFNAGKLFAALSAPEDNAEVLAAFSQITKAKNFDVYAQPSYVGEINEKKPYVRKYAPLILASSLTSQKVKGWRFIEGKTPIVDDYAGNFAEIPSNPVELEPVEFTAGRVAGGNKLDRIHQDFPDLGFWAAYLRESAADYDRKTDKKVRDLILSGTNEVKAGTVPAGVSPGWAKLVDGILALNDEFTPSFALIGADLYRDMLLTTDKDKFAFLNATLGWEEGQVNSFQFRKVDVGGKVTVGARESAELQELPGLIRVSALDVSHAATDEGCYGYNGTWIRDPRALVNVVDVLTGG